MKILHKNNIENNIIVNLTSVELKKISYAIILNDNTKYDKNIFISEITKNFLNIYTIKFNKDLDSCYEYIKYILNCDLEQLENEYNNTRVGKINKIKNKIVKTKLNF